MDEQVGKQMDGLVDDGRIHIEYVVCLTGSETSKRPTRVAIHAQHANPSAKTTCAVSN